MERLSIKMINRMAAAGVRKEDLATQVDRKLLQHVTSRLERVNNCLLFSFATRHLGARNSFPDEVGFEAYANKFHVEDFIDHPSDKILVSQSIIAARLLAARSDFIGCRVILSIMLDEPVASLTFFLKRPDQVFATDNPDDFEHECLAIYDAG